MNTEIDKNMAILMGHGTQNQLPELTGAEKKKLADAYSDLFFGLAGANWARGNATLGEAWYQALKQIDGMIGAKNKNNPAAMYLNQIHVAHRAKWSQTIMTHPQKDKHMEMSPESKQKWSSTCAKNIGAAMAVINFIITRYQARDNAQQTQATKADPTSVLKFIQSTQGINTK